MFDVKRIGPGRLPENLAGMAPGVELAQILARVNRDSLSGYDRVVLLQAHHRQVAHYQAELYADMVGVADEMAETLGSEFGLDEVEDSAAMEIRAALSLTRRASESQLELAHLLCERVPEVWVALNAGRIDLAKARVIIDQTLHLEPTLARAVADEVLDWAATATTGQLRARIARLVITVDPDSAKKRYEEGLDERRVTAPPNTDGTANLLGLHLHPARTQAVMRKINRLARAARSKDDPRTMDQLRADVLLDLLLGTNHQQAQNSPDRGIVDISVDLTTLIGLNQNPGRIPGWGPVIADIARQVAEEQSDAEHRITVTDENGQAIWTGTTRKRPTTGQRRQVETRNPTCVFPGCRMPAADCDIDHHLAREHGGPTQPWNLGPLCRHDHAGKHRGWKLEQTAPGIYQWTSPLGHTYTTGPDPP